MQLTCRIHEASFADIVCTNNAYYGFTIRGQSARSRCRMEKAKTYQAPIRKSAVIWTLAVLLTFSLQTSGIGSARSTIFVTTFSDPKIVSAMPIIKHSPACEGSQSLLRGMHWTKQTTVEAKV